MLRSFAGHEGNPFIQTHKVALEALDFQGDQALHRAQRERSKRKLPLAEKVFVCNEVE